ncbi:hypothetical protein V6N11_013256 [Hibiscus sabdariffa]|uniref:Uncharacterized protein n=1 Tax=Hibiscus sabdariffa TaxID=183260 RepID=A0ABR1Z6I9_9ROSI
MAPPPPTPPLKASADVWTTFVDNLSRRVTRGVLWELFDHYDSAWIDNALVGIARQSFDLEFVQKAIASDGIYANVAKWGNVPNSCIIIFDSCSEKDVENLSIAKLITRVESPIDVPVSITVHSKESECGPEKVASSLGKNSLSIHGVHRFDKEPTFGLNQEEFSQPLNSRERGYVVGNVLDNNCGDDGSQSPRLKSTEVPPLVLTLKNLNSSDGLDMSIGLVHVHQHKTFSVEIVPDNLVGLENHMEGQLQNSNKVEIVPIFIDNGIMNSHKSRDNSFFSSSHRRDIRRLVRESLELPGFIKSISSSSLSLEKNQKHGGSLNCLGSLVGSLLCMWDGDWFIAEGQFVQEAELVYLPLQGGSFTSSSNRKPPTLVLLDRFLLNYQILSTGDTSTIIG